MLIARVITYRGGKNTNRLANYRFISPFGLNILVKRLFSMPIHKPVNPLDFGLNSRIKIVSLSGKDFGIVKKRKSRIIMKDGIQIVTIANSIRDRFPESEITLIYSGPICSKTIEFLMKQNIKLNHE